MNVNNKNILIFRKHSNRCFMKFVVDDSDDKIISKLLNELNDSELKFISLGSVIIDKEEISYIEIK